MADDDTKLSAADRSGNLPAPSGTTAAMVTQSGLDAMLQNWKSTLNLEGWNIRASLVPASELSPNSLGHSHWDLERHTAEIKILNPSDPAYNLAKDQIAGDIECSVVHELTHISRAMAGVRLDGRRAEEWAVINQTDRLFYESYDYSPCGDVSGHLKT